MSAAVFITGGRAFVQNAFVLHKHCSALWKLSGITVLAPEEAEQCRGRFSGIHRCPPWLGRDKGSGSWQQPGGNMDFCFRKVTALGLGYPCRHRREGRASQ